MSDGTAGEQEEIENETNGNKSKLNDGLSCSFCKKGEGVVNQLITGPGVNICNECVIRCIQGISSELEKTIGLLKETAR